MSPSAWYVWCCDHKPATPLTLGTLLSHFHSRLRWSPNVFQRDQSVCHSSHLKIKDQEGAYRVLFQLQPFPIGKGGPSLGWVPVWGWGHSPCLLLHSEHLTAGLVFIVCALPGIDNPGEEAGKTGQTDKAEGTVPCQGSAKTVSTTGPELQPCLMQRTLWSWYFMFLNKWNFF